MLSVPAGLIDPEEKKTENPIFCAAKRELQEETGIRLEKGDRMTLVNPLLFSTPGMTDESNALVQIVLERDKICLLYTSIFFRRLTERKKAAIVWTG